MRAKGRHLDIIDPRHGKVCHPAVLYQDSVGAQTSDLFSVLGR
jgi:hypothetical protein